jgi:hypothetical protein
MTGMGKMSEPPRSRAERSDYAETSTYEDVVAFLDALGRASKTLHVEPFGVSSEGRALPLAVVSSPRVTSPAEALALDRPVAFVLANIHAGEVEGKEAAQHLLRRACLGDLQDLARRVVLLVAPIYNADGNERFGPQHLHRPGQNGPPSVGVRANAQGLDLNRDHMKLETPEARALVANVYTRWNPHLTVDCHSTDGSFHGYALTYAPPLVPNARPEPVEYVRRRLLPDVQRRLEARGLRTFHYGNFDDPADPGRGWRTFDHRPRFGNSYVGLRNRLCVLSEAYVYDDFRRRVESTETFVEALLRHVASDGATAREVCLAADRAAALRGRAPRPDDTFGVRFDLAPPEPFDLLARDAPLGPDRVVRTDVFHAFAATRSVRVPHGYLIEPSEGAVAELARRHGILVRDLDAPLRAPVESCRVLGVDRSAEAFQGHRTVLLDVEPVERTVDAAAGWFHVPMDQPLADLACYLLDPESDDGAVAWNLLDGALARLSPGARDAWLPVHRLRGPLPGTVGPR